jgi:hypothetical protein
MKSRGNKHSFQGITEATENKIEITQPCSGSDRDIKVRCYGIELCKRSGKLSITKIISDTEKCVIKIYYVTLRNKVKYSVQMVTQ